MTPSKIHALEAGPETDRLVAEALYPEASVGWCAASGCGLEGDNDVMAIWDHPDHDSDWIPCPKYSSDWSAAMLAAEEFGLFKPIGGRCLYQLDSEPVKWAIGEPDPEGCPMIVASAEAGPLAICRAILKLAGERKRRTTKLTNGCQPTAFL